jgi:AraC family transcriptional regulator
MPASAPRNLSASDIQARSHSGFRRVMHRGVPLAVHLRHTESDFGSSGPYMADTFGRMPAYLCVLQLHDYPAADGWRDGRHFDGPSLAMNSVMVLDLRYEWQTRVRAPFDNIHLNVTQSSLDELAEESGVGTVEIGLKSFAPFHDETLRYLGLSLMPALLRPAELSALFTEHVAMAAALHLVQTYGGRRAIVRRFAGGLAPWQERRARDYLLARLDADVDLKSLAAACGLSPGHFAKAFTRTVGLPPHRWLLKQRVARACDLLLHTGDPLHSIALACGFADQSHMSRVFSRVVGASPSAWRRARRS